MSSPAINTNDARFIRHIPMSVGVTLIFFIGIALSIASFFLVRSWEQKEIQNLFEARAHTRLAAFHADIISHQEVVSSIAALFPASLYVSREEFRTFVQDQLSVHSDIHALGWNPLIKYSERKLFEENTREEGFNNFQITEVGNSNQQQSAAKRDEYIAVHYIEPYTGNENAHGFDIASHPGRLIAIEKARDTGQPIITERVKLIQEKEEKFGYLLLKAVYRNGSHPQTVEERRNHFIGVAAGAFRFNESIPFTMRNVPPFGVDVLITDLSAPTEKQFLYFHSSRTRKNAFNPTPENHRNAKKGLHLQVTIEVAGRKWSFLFTPAPVFIKANPLWQCWAAFATGLLVTVLLMLLFLATNRFVVNLASKNKELLRQITERQLAEEALVKSEEMNRAIIDTSKDWIWSINLEGIHTYSNPAVEAILGYTLDELVGRQSLDLVHDEDRKIVEASLRESIKNQDGWNNTIIRWCHKGGGYRYLESNAVPHFDAEGNLAGFRGVDRDITERKNAEDAIKEREERLTALFESTVDGILVVDPETSELISCNNAMAKMMGYRVEEVVGLKVQDLHREEDIPYVSEQFELFVTEKSTGAVNIPFQRKDGSVFYADVTGFPFMMAGKRCIGGFFRDISGRKEIEKRLKQAAVVFESTSEAVVITNAKGDVVAVNNSFMEITGYTEKEVLEKNPRLWKSQHHEASFYKKMWSSLHENGEWRGEIWNRRKNGNVYPAWMSINAVCDEQDKLVNFVSVFSDISSIKQSQEKLHHLAHYDVLTTLPNRLLFNDRLEHALDRASRENRRVGVMFLDLDNFKPINDGLGHPIGDKVLFEVATRMRALIRVDDTVARIGGDEFAIILEEVTEPQGISKVAEKIISAFEVPLQVDNHELHVTITIGISIFPENGDNAINLVKNADAAMYRAKERGKNSYCFYTLDLTEVALKRLQIENELRVAIKNNEFSVFYQPQHSLTTGQLKGAEALVRWQHPKNGLTSPDKFIPLAESTGLIIPLGEWVLREACVQTMAWQKMGYKIPRIGVNVAGQQIQYAGFLETVRIVLEETGLAPECLELEVTESFIMGPSEDAIKTLEELRKLGVHLAIDDFGTGYSSLSYLKRLPVDRLKIDRSFVQDIPQNSDDKAIAKAVIAMGKSLQLNIIAEGVETEEQLSFMKIEGCHEVQGFLYSPPIPVQDFTAYLEKQFSSHQIRKSMPHKGH